MSDIVKIHYDPAVHVIQKTLEAAHRTNADLEVIEGLKRVLHFVDLRDAYALKCTTKESAMCQQIVELTHSHPWTELKEQGKTMWNLSPRMLSGPLEGQFLKSLVSMHRARRVLDVGMYTGYSALSMAEALPEHGEVITLEMDPYLEQLNKKSFDASPHGSKIQIKMGQAIDSMKEMAAQGQKFDLMFLDAMKSEYIDYLKIALEDGLLAENGTVVVDNTFRSGDGYLPTAAPDNPTRQFGEYIASNASLHKVLVPIRDGVMLIRRLSEVERDVCRQ